MNEIEELRQRITELENLFRSHAHTGNDGKQVDKSDIDGLPDFPVTVTLTSANNSAVNSGDATTDLVISNIRTRLGELISGLRDGDIIN